MTLSVPAYPADRDDCSVYNPRKPEHGLMCAATKEGILYLNVKSVYCGEVVWGEYSNQDIDITTLAANFPD